MDINVQNIGLLLKFLHSFYNRKDVPWINLVWSSYYENEVPHAAAPCGSFWWKDVMQLSDIYRGITSVSVGDGRTTLFWKDLWQDQLLMESHPRAYSFTKLEDASVAALLGITTAHDGFHLPLSPQARNEVRDLQLLTEGMNTDNECNDVWTCVWGGEYTSAKFYRYYFKDVDTDEVFPWIWGSKCTMKLKVFAWLVFADRINTKNMLRRRHYRIDDDAECVLCNGRIEETVEHLFFLCPFSKKCWETVGIRIEDCGNRLNIIHSAKRNWRRPMFMEIFVTAAWSIWKERNGKIFRRITLSFASWRQRFKQDFGLLVHRVNPQLSQSVKDFSSAVT